MANARNYLAIAGENVFIFENGHGTGVHHSELLSLMAESRSLAEVKTKFRASRSNPIETLEHFGFDFDILLREQFREGHRDTTLAKLHRVDTKWIAEKRRSLGFSREQGRPPIDFTRDEILRARGTAESIVGAAEQLGIDRKTFSKLYLSKLRSNGPVETDRMKSSLPSNKT
ncbi:hypothetical protein GCM10011415_14890 [Salipiger pallidus]|uniref:Uncharacterized protein n=1 Tax=Salipiger pallidus TaxID=1775170 RepID=A0A8J3EFX5_9RHOB|nr:hypothetical protein [Salipiger pallidus]GGG68684.1 hypothetical protein GCM10011415_14890 [Salipiger pallidus]